MLFVPDPNVRTTFEGYSGAPHCVVKVVFPAFLVDGVSEALQQTPPVGHVIAAKPVRGTCRRCQAVAILTEKRSPIHEPFPRYVIDASPYDERAFMMRGKHPLGPIRQDNNMVFDNTDDFGARFPER
jgi:hypothetical protein